MHEEMIQRLRETSMDFGEVDHVSVMLLEAADAIEELSKERKTGKWINYLEDGFVVCPFCGAATNCDGEISELHYCFNCGAELENNDDV